MLILIIILIFAVGIYTKALLVGVVGFLLGMLIYAVYKLAPAAIEQLPTYAKRKTATVGTIVGCLAAVMLYVWWGFC